MFVYLINECLLAHLYLLLMLSCHCLRRCVNRLPLRNQVLRAQEGSLACLWGSRSSERRREPGKYILTGFSPGTRRVVCFKLVPCATLSVGTLCGALIIGWHLVSAHWSHTRDLLSRELTNWYLIHVHMLPHSHMVTLESHSHTVTLPTQSLAGETSDSAGRQSDNSTTGWVVNYKLTVYYIIIL